MCYEKVKEGVSQNYRNLERACNSLRNFREIVELAIRFNGNGIEFTCEAFRDDKDLVILALKKDYANSFDSASERLRCDKEVAIFAVSEHGRALQHADVCESKCEKLKNDKEVVIAGLDSKHSFHGNLGMYAGKEIKKDEEFIRKCILEHNSALTFQYGSLNNDKEVILASVSHRSNYLEYASPDLRDDKDVVLKAISQNTCIYGFKAASERLSNDKEVVLTALLLQLALEKVKLSCF